jgi:hypothetical protein
MKLVRRALFGLSLLAAGACGGLTSLSPVAPSASPALSVTAAGSAIPATQTQVIGPDVQAGLFLNQQVMNGRVGPLGSDAPCYVERYACQKYGFTLMRNGAVEVTLTWQGGERAMLIQLYRAGAGLVHEDVAPRGGAPQITFRRTDLPAMDYELRVVNMEPMVAHAFNLTLTRWE